MRHQWLAISFIMGSFFAGAATAGPPIIGDTGREKDIPLWPSFESWTAPSFLTNLAAPSMPEWPAASEPSILRQAKTTLGRAWRGTKRTTLSAWESTKYALRPYDAPARRKANSDDGGFWAELFSADEPAKEMTTVNDFLKQPMPY